MPDIAGSSADLLMREAKKFATRRLRGALRSATDRVADFGDRLDSAADEGGGAVTDTLKEAGQALLPGGGGKLGKLASSAAELVSGGNGRQPRRGTSIVEEIDVGVPVQVAYNQWTQFTRFPDFAKGAKRVEQQDDERVRWEAKVFWSRREWTAEITEQVPDKRIAWTSQGSKGTVDGVVTFHELAPELTKVLLALEYHPKGAFEHIGNLWRAQGRRARLDLKRFRSYVMQRGEETGAWRGEIQDGQVSSGEDEADEEKAGGDRRSQRRSRAERDESESSRERGRSGEGSRRRDASAESEDEAYPQEGGTTRRRARSSDDGESGSTRRGSRGGGRRAS